MSDGERLTIGNKGVEAMDAIILWNLIGVAGALFVMFTITLVCFIEAVKMFYFRIGPGMGGFPVDWWDYPFIPVFGYFITTLIAALATVLIAQNCVENILEALRSAELINF